MTTWHQAKANAKAMEAMEAEKRRADQEERWRAESAKYNKQGIKFNAEKEAWGGMANLIRDNSLCLCNVEDSEVPCWQHAETALEVLWVACGGACPVVHCGTFRPFYSSSNKKQRKKFIDALGTPCHIVYKGDAWGYRLSCPESSKPIATGPDLAAALHRYRTNLAARLNPGKLMVERTWDSTFQH